MVFSGVVILLLILIGIVENAFHQKRLKEIPVRILVNGTRGKTSICSLLTAVLNENGYRAVGRTTGSEARILHHDGTSEPFIRRLPARITEMVPFIRLCSHEKADCVIVECMALGAEYQKAFSRMLIKPTHVIISNSYVDHVAEIGSTKEETIWTLANSIYPGCDGFFTESEYKPFCEERGSRFHLVAEKNYQEMNLDSRIPVHNSNVSLAVALCNLLGISESLVLQAIGKAIPDVGLQDSIMGRNGSLLIPSFSINDYHCMSQAIDDAKYNQALGKNLCVIFNNRSDREYRIILMKKILKAKGHLITCVYCIGDYPDKVMRFFKSSGVNAMSISVSDLYQKFNSDSDETVFLGLGNIKGGGNALLEMCMGEKR
ncbi:MAG: poly-gamma-glutamate synthase PgsB [Sphaerochaetaceae bacterium]|jgi:gamma-polyglutamate synthase|nr:poly-gamma-glutamate synthase PgsB [Sphaerochaetaceae bacterium]